MSESVAVRVRPPFRLAPQDRKNDAADARSKSDVSRPDTRALPERARTCI